VKEAALLGVMVCPADGGLRVTSVRSGSPAARAAILPGDIVTSIDGTPVRRLLLYVHVRRAAFGLRGPVLVG
jgi:S1-C subfamily serine protease